MTIDGKKKKKFEKLKNVLLFYNFTLEIFNWGVFLPITKSPKYSTTVPNSVNDTQDFMSIKHKAFMPCKLHPTRHHQSPSLSITWFSPLTEQIPSFSLIIHHHRVQPSHLASHHQSPSLSITWFSPLIEQIPSVSSNIHHQMVQPTNWLDTIFQ